MAELSGVPVFLPAICRLRLRSPSPLGHATLPTVGASVTAGITMDVELNGRSIEIYGAIVGNWPSSRPAQNRQ